jgi:hypothetical protein
MSDPKAMPILDGYAETVKEIPWSLIAGHERQANLNHNQSLRELARRGGISPYEAMAIIQDRPWTRMSPGEADRILRELIAAHKPE